jgi:uncharacterized membrane protein YkvI
MHQGARTILTVWICKFGDLQRINELDDVLMSIMITVYFTVANPATPGQIHRSISIRIQTGRRRMKSRTRYLGV